MRQLLLILLFFSCLISEGQTPLSRLLRKHVSSGPDYTLIPINGIVKDSFISASKRAYNINDIPTLRINPDSTGWGIVAWVNLSDISSSHVIVSKDDDATTLGSEYYLGYYPGYSGFVFQIETGTSEGSGTEYIISTIGNPTPGRDYLVMGWYDKTDSTVKIKIDNSTIDTLHFTTGNLHSTSTPFSIGSAANSDSAISGGFMNGKIKCVGLFNRPFTTTDFNAFYNLQTVSFSDTMELRDKVNISFTPNSFTGMLIAYSSSSSTYIRLLNSTTIRVQGDAAGYKDFTVPTMIAASTYSLEVSNVFNSITVKLNGTASSSGAQGIIGNFIFDEQGIYWDGTYPSLNFDGTINSITFSNPQPISAKPSTVASGLIHWWDLTDR